MKTERKMTSLTNDDHDDNDNYRTKVHVPP